MESFNSAMDSETKFGSSSSKYRIGTNELNGRVFYYTEAVVDHILVPKHALSSVLKVIQYSIIAYFTINLYDYKNGTVTSH